MPSSSASTNRPNGVQTTWSIWTAVDARSDRRARGLQQMTVALKDKMARVAGRPEKEDGRTPDTTTYLAILPTCGPVSLTAELLCAFMHRSAQKHLTVKVQKLRRSESNTRATAATKLCHFELPSRLCGPAETITVEPRLLTLSKIESHSIHQRDLSDDRKKIESLLGPNGAWKLHSFRASWSDSHVEVGYLSAHS